MRVKVRILKNVYNVNRRLGKGTEHEADRVLEDTAKTTETYYVYDPITGVPWPFYPNEIEIIED